MNRQLRLFLYLVQGVGAIFYGVFSAAYVLPFPSMAVLSGEPMFKLLLLTFGGLFLILSILTVVLSALIKRESEWLEPKQVCPPDGFASEPPPEDSTLPPTEPTPTPQQTDPTISQPGFLGSNLPVEYGYAIVATIVVAVAAATGYTVLKRKK